MAPFGKETAVVQEGRSAAVSTVARETRLVGELSGTQAVRVEGGVQGTVTLKAALEVAEQATVEAEVNATTVRVAGTVVGNITATELVELLASAVVKGDITTPALHVVEGARLEGRVLMRVETPASKPGARSPGKPPGPAEEPPTQT
jgi:cytoskeletal protein CcmA (bactofilin family)